MKILLTAINAKYIHSNLAIYSLKAYADAYLSEQVKENVELVIKEYTINNLVDEILEDLYREKPEVLCFSCYIWNISYVKILIKEIKVLLPDLHIWLGGPEVSYDADDVLTEFPQVQGVMRGEGEKVFCNLCTMYGEKKNDFSGVRGVTYRTISGEIKKNLLEMSLDMSDIPFPYTDTLVGDLSNRIIYYESSRGCPFSCSYCLSSIDKTLRFRSLDLVRKELDYFIARQVRQVKFVDRTFNCKKSHAIAIWKYILEKDNGITNFHFEIGADLLDEEEIQILKQMRPGLVQLEIGVQSTHEPTIKEVSRQMNLSDLEKAVSLIRGFHNINLHLDLIAGLPYEDLTTFRKSFNDVYKMYADQLQLGFLKVLKGSAIEERKDTYGTVHKTYPPYEVMYTEWLSFDDVLELKEVESMVENYYNSGQFTYTLKYLENFFEEPFDIYYELGKYYTAHFNKAVKHSRIDRYNILLRFIQTKGLEEYEENIVKELMTFDIYLRENMKTRPAFAPDVTGFKERFRGLSREKNLKNMEHLEILSKETVEFLRLQDVKFEYVEVEQKDYKDIMYFDYKVRNPLNSNAAVKMIKLKEESKKC